MDGIDGFCSDTVDVRAARRIASDSFQLTSASICLVTTNVAFTRATADSVYFAGEATYPGYARQPVTLTDATRFPDGTIGTKMEHANSFHPSNDTFGGASVFGAFLLSSDSVVLGKIPFNPPIPLRNTLDTLFMTLAWRNLSECSVLAMA